MLNVIYAELLKLRHSKIRWLVLLGALPANLVTLGAFLPRVTPDGTSAAIDIQDMFYRQGMFLIMMGPAIFALITAYIFAREYQERTINQLFSYPVSRVNILMAKLAVVFLQIVMTTVLSCASVFIVVFLMLLNNKVDVHMIWTGLKTNALICILSFGTIPVAAAVSMVGKNVIPTAVLGVFTTIVTVIGEIGHGRQNIMFPWLTPFWPVRDLAQGIADNDGPNPFAVPALSILSITFLAGLLYSIVYYSKHDVHSGS
ncbi:hypothetical protein E5161_08280 [Cohnella pontilimi]|uniref:ABC transporter permease n=1 Tax=Cohnella pontilimi TaxID=2564100 RepID=A0A4U0FDC4_9BACL|nr:ABC transporter permease [Cohnella pontilimi]TJY42825.1 hypothetical protein E5161_08280 [Cohnella pontilimi]